MVSYAFGHLPEWLCDLIPFCHKIGMEWNDTIDE